MTKISAPSAASSATMRRATVDWLRPSWRAALSVVPVRAIASKILRSFQSKASPLCKSGESNGRNGVCPAEGAVIISRGQNSATGDFGHVDAFRAGQFAEMVRPWRSGARPCWSVVAAGGIFATAQWRLHKTYDVALAEPVRRPIPEMAAEGGRLAHVHLCFGCHHEAGNTIFEDPMVARMTAPNLPASPKPIPMRNWSG